jgi:hypothetical protein
MSTPDEWDDRIHAYVDGELDAFTAARLEAACRQDATLNARVEKQRRLQQQLRAGLDPVLDEPVPARLLEAVMKFPTANGATPINVARPRARVQPLWFGALAASLVIGVAIGWLAPRESGLPIAAGSNGLVATGYLDAALSQSLSSDGRSTAGVQVPLSFQASDGAYCRSFSLTSGTDGLACRAADRWHIEVMGQARPQAGQDYRQAGSALSAAVLAVIGARQSGDTLDLEQEKQARGTGWQASDQAGH